MFTDSMKQSTTPAPNSSCSRASTMRNTPGSFFENLTGIESRKHTSRQMTSSKSIAVVSLGIYCSTNAVAFSCSGSISGLRASTAASKGARQRRKPVTRKDTDSSIPRDAISITGRLRSATTAQMTAAASSSTHTAAERSSAPLVPRVE